MVTIVHNKTLVKNQSSFHILKFVSLTHSPLNCPCGSTSLLTLYIVSINSQGTFKPFQNEQNSVKEAGVKGKKIM